MEFSEFNLDERLLSGIQSTGYVNCTPVQQQVIEASRDGSDLYVQSQTGTGKTAAFALPILETVSEEDKSVQALILTPTRELALQVSEEINSLKGERKTEVTPIYGGASMEIQLKKLKRGVQIVVGTPGRILDHIKRGTLNLDKLVFMVLDEADEMLDMGFIEDIEEVLKNVPETRRMLMFSATIPPQIQKLAETFMKNPTLIRTQKSDAATPQADQIYFEVKEADKIEALTRIIDRDPDFYGVIFCRTKLQCDEIGHKLQARGYDAEALHGDLSQRERETILRKMKERVIRILVATDVAARGLDIQDLTHVINYSLPSDPEIYIHRVGRTGRAGKEGTAITFITPSEARRFSYIKKASKSEIRKEEIPTPKEVVERRRELIKEELFASLDKDGKEEYSAIAEDLLSDKNPVDVLSSILSLFYKDALDESQYKDISVGKKKERTKKKSNAETSYSDRKKEDRERPYDKIKTPSMDDEGLTRLFIARGRNDGLTKRGLADVLIDQAGVKNEDIRDIQVMEDFSFINAPYDAAEHILRVFGKSRNGEKPIITKARKDDKPKKKTTESSQKKETASKPKREKSSPEKKKEKKTRDYLAEEAEFLEYQRSWNEEREKKSKGRKAKASSSKKSSSKPKAKSKRGRK